MMDGATAGISIIVALLAVASAVVLQRAGGCGSGGHWAPCSGVYAGVTRPLRRAARSSSSSSVPGAVGATVAKLVAVAIVLVVRCQ